MYRKRRAGLMTPPYGGRKACGKCGKGVYGGRRKRKLTAQQKQELVARLMSGRKAKMMK